VSRDDGSRQSELTRFSCRRNQINPVRPNVLNFRRRRSRDQAPIKAQFGNMLSRRCSLTDTSECNLVSREATEHHLHRVRPHLQRHRPRSSANGT
jgi:hypothetical protein